MTPGPDSVPFLAGAPRRAWRNATEHTTRFPRGLHLFGVIRRAGAVDVAAEPTLVLVEHGELAALTVTGPFGPAPFERAALLRHQRTVEWVMHRTPIVPAPFGIAFRDRPSVHRFLRERRAALAGALAFVDDRWEMRVHFRCTAGKGGERRDAVLAAYRELRRGVRAAVPLRARGGRPFGAAFLVDRTRWLDFVDRVHVVGESNPELDLDLTGPWPPYDFITLHT